MTVPGNIYTIILIAAVVTLFAVYIAGLIKSLKAGSTMKRTYVPALTVGFLLCVYLVLNAREIGPADFGQIMLMLALVLVTGFYALSAYRQADASVKMAKEMREQRRPIVVPKAFPAKGVPLQASAEEIEKHVYSDYFEIYNKGNSPAIDLEVLLLNQGKSRLGNLKETVFSRDDAPLTFHPSGLGSYLNSTCYLVCQYLSVLPANADKKWYETWLPFIPKKSQRGDQIIIVPGELEFTESSEKKSY